jgi:zona occludens toxin
MIYLTTGGNGTFKTCNTIKLVHDLAVKENRPVAYNGRFDLIGSSPIGNWKRIDVKDWQAEPDGTIFFFDECHNDFPVRPASATPPDYVRMLSEHRKRGFDFFLLTIHPQNIDAFVRRHVQAPGYHRHHKRVAGAELVSVLQWDAVNPTCERPGSGATGQVSMVAGAKEAYPWYRSATLHTAKFRLPKAVYVLALAIVLVPTAF